MYGSATFNLSGGRQIQRERIQIAYWNEVNQWQGNPLFAGNPINIAKSKRFATLLEAKRMIRDMKREIPKADLEALRVR